MEIRDEDIIIETLKGIKIIEESKKTNIVDLEKVNIINPFLITPLTAYLNKTLQNSQFSKGLGQGISKKFLGYDEQDSSQIGSKKNSLNNLLKLKIIKPKNEYAKSYLKTLKFPNTINHEKELKSIRTKTYCPLYEIKNEILKDNKEIIELLEKIIINKYELKENISTLMLIFDELMCNICEHANSSFNCIQTQKYDNKLAISIVDTGVTIPQNYINKGIQKNQENNLDLLKLVFQGISTKPEKERGTGIPNSYNLICKALKGSLLIISKNVGFVKLSKTDIQFFNLDELNLNFEGTIINILFEIPKKKIDYLKFLNKPCLEN